jgi:replicative DNA helicase
MMQPVHAPDGVPSSIHTEVTILGAMMLDPVAIVAATEKLRADDFALDSHRKIYRAVLSVVEEYRLQVDEECFTLVRSELAKRKELDAIGGPAYLSHLTEGVPRNLNIESYVQIVRDKAVLRELLNLFNAASIRASDQGEDAADLMNDVEKQILDLMSDTTVQSAESTAEITPRVVDKIREERENPSTDDALGLSFDIPELDRLTRGMYPNEYTLILGDTNSAKTAWAVQITLKNAMKGRGVHWNSMEMTKEQLTRRMLASLATMVTARQIRDPRFMGLQEFGDLEKTARILERLPITIDDSRQLPIDVAVARAKAKILKDDTKLFVGDYLQLFRPPNGVKHHVADVERQETNTLSLRDLAATAKNGAHVLALSQYSRPGDATRKKAGNDRAKGSSSIEQSAHTMLHIVREENEDGSWSNEVEIRIGKAREGKRGSVRCLFDEDHLRFKGVEA